MAGTVNIDFNEMLDKVKAYFESLNRNELLGFGLVGLGIILLIVGAILW